MILIILIASSTVYCQNTETKQVKVSVLKAMGKNLEKCKLQKSVLDLKSKLLDSVTAMNIHHFNQLEAYQNERKTLQLQLESLNLEKQKYLKQKKRSWIVPAMCLIGGIAIGGNL